MGYPEIHPTSNGVSLAAMAREIAVRNCEFWKDLPKDMPDYIMLRLQLVCFGSRHNKGYELKLHSYLCEVFAGNWELNKCHHYL